MISSSTKTIGIVGHVWDSAGGESLKTLVIGNGKISRVLDGRQTITDIPDITMISLDDNVTLFPGLINLHTHTTYNILPIWESRTIWKNRFQWRANADYKQDIGGLLDYIKNNWKNDPDKQFVTSFAHSVHAALKKPAPDAAAGTEALVQSALSVVNTAYAVISEIQAVAGGTTLIQETLNLDNEIPDDRSFIIRNTGDADGLSIPATKDIYSVVDFYEPNVKAKGTADEDTSGWTPVVQAPYKDFVQSVNNNNSKYYSTLVHVGEGKSGFVKGSVADAYSRKEIAALIQSLRTDVTLAGSLGKANLSITHGCGIDLTDASIMDFLQTNHIALVWSPVSNLLLYQDTIDVRKLLDKKIVVCLGSDWSPSGSKHVLDELKFASFVNHLLKMGMSPGELFDMVTANAVDTLGITGTGAIRQGYNADVFALRKKSAGEDALKALFASADSDIDFVMVNGRMVFGLTSYFTDQLKVDFEGFSAAEGSAAAKRGVSINSKLGFDLAGSLSIIDTLLRRYCDSVIHKPHLQRTKFLAADDPVYQGNIRALREQMGKIYP